jgi:hypothetical protein
MRRRDAVRADWSTLRERLQSVLAALDWGRLGAVYFHDDGERLLTARRAGIVDLGLPWAKALLARLPRGGRSLYAGAGLAELPAMLAEVLLHERTVQAVNLRQEECELLAAGLRTAGLADVLAIECREAGDAAAGGGFDHVAAVSLFTDPETWPLLSDVTYGRIAPLLIDVVRFAQEREAARALAARLWAGVRPPAWITTTAEEVSWFMAAAQTAGVPLVADDELLETAIVGDPVGFLRVG